MREIVFDSDDLTNSSDSTEQLLRQLRGVLVKYPIASQAAYRALVREGRTFAETEEGAKLRDSLAKSKQVARLRDVWSIGTLNIMSEKGGGPIPSAYLEALAAAATNLDETQLSQVFESVDDLF